MEIQKTQKSRSSLEEQSWFALPHIKPGRKGEYLAESGREGRFQMYIGTRGHDYGIGTRCPVLALHIVRQPYYDQGDG